MSKPAQPGGAAQPGTPRPAESRFDLPSLAPLPTAAERAAEAIRDGIFEGKFAPGTSLPETALANALQVSRNTVREAFRALVAEHLLVYEANKGMSVRVLTAGDVRDIYRLRRLFELSAIDALTAGRGDLDKLGLLDLVGEGDRAIKAGDGAALGTVNLRFHQLIVAIHRSPRISEIFRRLMTEMRLGFLAVPDPVAFHGVYHERNQAILTELLNGSYAAAHEQLAAYLDEAMDTVAAAVDAS